MFDATEIQSNIGISYSQPADLHRLARHLTDEEDRVMGVGDVTRLTAWSQTTVKRMVKERRIPMLWIEGRWVITRKNFRKAADHGFPPPEGRAFTTKERKLAELRIVAKKVVTDPTPQNLEELRRLSL